MTESPTFIGSIGLLSLPNWIIHLSSTLEWGIAALMMFRYGMITGRKDIRMFGISMLPHWVGSFFIIAYHLTGDSIPLLLDLSETVNLFGSAALLYAVLTLLKKTSNPTPTGYATCLATIMIAGKPQSYLGEDIFDAILQVSSIVYITFLVLLIVVRKRDPEVFSPLTVAGFWFVLVFISFTVFSIYLATEVRGNLSLSHDDLLHGLAESLLTLSNLMIVIGIHRQTVWYEKLAKKAESA
ncbi:DUF3593 domain-containing protein [Chlorobium phaeobacteroides]|uniref:DUF3593 domain-containing protein n=1 Tax=Chlorobium phaeobacteroides (strain DSM 266 / SMG 266 / 2430) TaxID=290317 RepID=A1BCI6_CHLPD|nr:DUF3593 domain-containing protein [Chlorobium phaeobacteroides]ABL64113.1 conserved hypothetical protein [Chlorobium phaeobacteroides DSM 266]